MRGLRNAADFLRVRHGVTERKCLACNKWKVEATEYTTQTNHGQLRYIARCKPCNSAHRAAKAISAPRQPAVEFIPPPEPPGLAWDTVLRGVL